MPERWYLLLTGPPPWPDDIAYTPLIDTQGSVGVAAIERFPCHKHVTSGAARMREFSLFRNHHGVPHVAVPEVYPEFHPTGFPDMATLHQSCQQP